MSRIVLKERKFNPTNNDLGVFSSVDLETVEMRYKESDVVNDSEGNDGNKSKNHVPKPKDEDSIKPSFDNFKPPDSSGGGSGGSDNKKKDEDKGKEKVDLENIQEPDIESEDFSNNQDNQGNGESGTGSSSKEGGDSENQPSSGSSGEQMNGGNSSPIDNNKSKESEGEDDSGQGQNGSNQNNQNGNSNGTGEGGEDTEDDYGGDEDSENGSSQSTNGNSQKSEKDNGSDLEGQGGDSGEQASQNSSDDSQQDDGSGNSQSGEEGNNPQKGNDGSQNSKSQNSKQEGESSNNSNSQNGQNGQGGQSKDSPDGGDSGDVQQGEDGNEEGSDRLEGWDDEEDDYGEDSESELEKALKKAENSLSDLEKKEREKIEKEDKNNDSKPQPKQLSDVEKKAAKDLIEDAIRSAKDKGDDENVEEMNDLLSKLDAHTLTSMVNVRGKGDWKHQLDKIFDQATGAEISINPNLVNKRIEDAPPGREDDTNQITNIAVLMDQSGSMGSHQFKTAISHVDTMLSVRKLGNVNFHIVGFSDWSLKKTAGTYKKTKGRMLKKVLLSEYSASDSGTNLTEAFQVLATKVRKVDAIMIFTDAEIWDDRKFNDNQMVMSYVKRNKRKIIWVLTHDVNEAKQKGYIMKFTPYSAKNKLYVRFKKSSS